MSFFKLFAITSLLALANAGALPMPQLLKKQVLPTTCIANGEFITIEADPAIPVLELASCDTNLSNTGAFLECLVINSALGVLPSECTACLPSVPVPSGLPLDL
ncbi:hypothetical protein M422DRAFT_241560 [Sphaerobolus stellatus SS14]|nr:hypothetical protein M422DRAFT_241560 [Sphaerobolus stellatus SS14]